MILTEYQLRTGLLSFMKNHSPNLYQILGEWTEKLGAGIPIEREFLYDLFGKQIEAHVPAEYVQNFHVGDVLYHLTYDLAVDPDNPFGVYFVYKILRGTSYEVAEVFMFGEEQNLVLYCQTL